MRGSIYIAIGFYGINSMDYPACSVKNAVYSVRSMFDTCSWKVRGSIYIVTSFYGINSMDYPACSVKMLFIP